MGTKVGAVTKKRLKAKNLSRCNSLKIWEINGRGERIRTSDLLVPNQALYQAEPRPEMSIALNLLVYHGRGIGTVSGGGKCDQNGGRSISKWKRSGSWPDAVSCS